VEKLSAVPSQITPGRVQTDKEKFECELIQTLLLSYFNIVRKNIKDLVPKTIMHFLVNNSKDSMQNELVSALYREDNFEKLLEESPLIAQRRLQCKQLLETLKRGNSILNEVRDFTIK
jgi:replication fork clamp-binding protein CrfC